MGFDKAALVVDGEPCAARLARLLGAVSAPVLEVGPGWTGLRAVSEQPPCQGPLAAIAVGWSALRRAGHDGPAIVLACDLPLVTLDLLELLANRPGVRSVLPIVAGKAQPLCARWSATDLAAAAALVKSGERSLRQLPSREAAELLDEATWSAVAEERAFADADTTGELDRLGVSWRRGVGCPRQH
ncbi:MAG: molybdopterin-guanine dinucleotide biosynthesis protein [Acidimicrobiaceae bacterium]|nr:molybdopterin-guanine dinucleotide biosynthesis protein [Acidimicrobiaceae bacterium]